MGRIVLYSPLRNLHSTPNGIFFLSITAIMIFVLTCPIFFGGITEQKASAAAGKTISTSPSSSTMLLAKQQNEVRSQFKGFNNFGNLPSSGTITNFSNPADLVKHTPFAPYAKYGQFPTANSAPPPPQQAPLPQGFSPSSSPYSPSSNPYSPSSNPYSPYSQPYQNQSLSQYPGQYPYQASPQSPASTQYPYSNSYPYQNQSSYPYASNPYSNQLQQLQGQPQQPDSSQYTNNPIQGQQQTSNSTSSHLSTLMLRTLVNNGATGVGLPESADPANLSQLVENVYSNPDGYTYVYHYAKASPTGVTIDLHPGSFSVAELSKSQMTGAYRLSYSGDCHAATTPSTSATGMKAKINEMYGYGTVKLGETKTCIVTNTLQK